MPDARMTHLRTPPYEPSVSSARPEPSARQRIAIAIVLGLIALPTTALLGLFSLMVPLFAFATLIPLFLAWLAAHHALALPRDRKLLRVGLLVLPFLTACTSVPLVSFLTFTCIKGTNSCW